MPTPKLTNEIITAAILGFESQKTKIDVKIAELKAMLPGGSTQTAATLEPPKRKRKKFSAASSSSSTVCDAKWRQLVDSTQGDASRREILVSRRLSQIAENRSCYPQLSARS